MRRWLPIVPLIVIVIAAALVLRANRVEPHHLPSDGHTAAVSPSLEVPVAAPRVAPSAPADSASEPSRPADDPDASTAPPTSDPAKPGELDRILVDVVDLEGEPLGGVPVAFQWEGKVHEFGRRDEDGQSASRVETETQALAHTDDRGRAELLAAGSGIDRVGDGLVDDDGWQVACAVPMPNAPRVPVRFPRASTDVLRLVVPREALRWLEPLRVRVVDPDGKPAGGVGVALRASRVNDPSESSVLARERTNRDGMAFFARGSMKRRIEESGAFAIPLAFEIEVSDSFADAPRVDFGPAPGPDEVVLQLPPTASVTVVVVDEHGARVDQGADSLTVTLAVRAVGSPESFPFVRARSAAAIEGRALFSTVGLFQELRVRARREARAPSAELRVAGPMQSGENLELRLRQGAAFPWITGRVLLEDGTPVTTSKLEATFSASRPASPLAPAGDVSSPTFDASTDGSARFWIPMRRPEDGTEAVALTLVFGRTSARVELTSTIVPGTETDLGEIRLKPFPLLIAGRVVDDAGQPVSGAELEVSHRVRGQWTVRTEELDVQGARSGRDGYFRIVLKDPPDRVDVVARSGGVGNATASAKDVPAGTDDLELVLRARRPPPPTEVGAIRGRVTVDSGISLDHLEADLLHADGRHRDDFERIDPSGAFAMEAVEVGPCRFRLRTSRAHFAVIHVSPIEIVGGETIELEDFDLRDSLRYVHLTLTTDAGHPIVRDTVWVRDAVSGAGGGPVRTGDRGRLAVLVPSYVDRLHVRTKTHEGEVAAGRDPIDVSLAPR